MAKAGAGDVRVTMEECRRGLGAREAGKGGGWDDCMDGVWGPKIGEEL